MNDSVIRDDAVPRSDGFDYRRMIEGERAGVRVGILDAAGRLLTEEGPQALSMRRIAKEVNASTQVLYTLYGNKAGLADALFREGFARLTAAHERDRRPADPLTHLRDRALVYFDNAVANPNYYRVMFFDAIPGFRPSAEVLSETWGTFDALSRAVAEAARAGSLPPRFIDSPQDAAAALWSAAHGVVSLHIVGQLSDRAGARELLDRNIGRILTGLQTETEAQ